MCGNENDPHIFGCFAPSWWKCLGGIKGVALLEEMCY